MNISHLARTRGTGRTRGSPGNHRWRAWPPTPRPASPANTAPKGMTESEKSEVNSENCKSIFCSCPPCVRTLRVMAFLKTSVAFLQCTKSRLPKQAENGENTVCVMYDKTDGTKRNNKNEKYYSLFAQIVYLFYFEDARFE